MGLQQSKDELLYQQVNYGNIEGIKALRREGAGLEWIDKEGKTPLILACLRPDLLPVAKTLIELGANVNAYRPGGHAGTPLHHAAKRGLDQTVNLLLSHGANALLMNDDCQTALDLAREKGHCIVVRSIENRICLFSGWLRELYGPSFLEAFARNWVTRKVWVIVLPCDSRNPSNPTKFDLAIYPDLQVAKPVAIIALWKVHIEEPKFNQPDPALTMLDKSKKRVYKFFSANDGDKQQLLWFYNACRGIRQINNYVQATPMISNPPHPLPYAPGTSTGPTVSSQEDIELAMALRASIESAVTEGVPLLDAQPTTPGTSSATGWGIPPHIATPGGWGPPEAVPPSKTSGQGVYNGWDVPAMQTEARPSNITPSTQEVPSAPPIVDEALYDGPIHYPAIDSSPVDLTMPTVKTKSESNAVKDGATMESKPETSGVKESSSDSGSCVICLDAPVEGACIPCGHMAGCMSCLNEIKAKGWGCPVCRTNIQQVVKLYAV